MKIGMFVNNLEVSGGYQKLVIRLSQQLQNLGHTVIVFTPRLDRKACYPNDIGSLKIVTIPKELANLTPVESYTALTKQVDSDFDALIIHDELSLLGIALLPEPLPSKLVWMLNNQLPENLRSYRQEVQSVYRQTVGNFHTKRQEVQKAIRRIGLIRKGLQRLTNFVTYDAFNQQLVKRILHCKATVVSAGADLEQFKKYAGTRTFKLKKQFTLLSVGVVFPHRRYEDVIEATAILQAAGKEIEAVIVGRQDLSPDYFKSLQALVQQRHVQDYVSFKNYVTDQEMIKLYKAADAFAFINDGFTWGIAVFEAIAAKLPVIITNNIGAADLITPQKTGWVIAPRSPGELADAISSIKDNPAAASEVAETAYRTITDFVSWEAYTKRMLAVLQDHA